MGDPARSSEAHRAGRGAVASAILQTSGRVFGFAFLLVATRVLDPQELGRYSTAAGLFIFFGFIADFGTSLAVLRAVSAKSGAAHELLRGTLGLSLVLGVAAAAMAIAFGVVVGYPADTMRLVVVAALALPLSALLTTVLAVLDGLGEIDRRAVLTLVQSAIVAGGGALALLLGLGAMGATACLILGPAIVLPVALWLARRVSNWDGRIGHDRGATSQLFRASIPFAVLGALAAITTRADLVVVSVLEDAAETASYDVAVRSVEALSFLGAAIAGPTLYLLTRRLERGDGAAAQGALDVGLRLSYAIGLLMAAGVCAFSQPIVEILFGAEFDEAVGILCVLAVSLAASIAVSMLGTAVLAAGLAKQVIPLSASLAVFVIATALTGVTLVGAIGAAVAVALFKLVAVAGYSWMLRSRVTLVPRLPRPALLAGAISIGTLSYVALSYAGLAVAIATFTASVLLVAVLTARQEIEDLRRLLSTLRPRGSAS